MKRAEIARLMLEIAELMSEHSTCTRVRSVGAVLASPEGHIVSTGFNGAPRGVRHCDDMADGCQLGPDGSCVRAVHAEMNCILQCALRGTSAKGATLYSTCFPCPQCAQAVVQAGVKELVWDRGYRDRAKFAAAEQLLAEGGVALVHISELEEAEDED